MPPPAQPTRGAESAVINASTHVDSSTDAVADAIRGALVRGDYAPGQRLVEADLCATYAVSRATVREALRELAADGLIELEPHKAARVRLVTLDEAIELAEVRMAVESLIARKAAERITPAGVAELRRLGTEMRDAAAAFDPLGYSELNERLHVVIARIARHDTASGVVERLRLQLVRYQMRLSLLPGRPGATLADHERIIAAIAAGDPDAAGSAMRDHLAEVAEALRASAGADDRPGPTNP
jgi:DNA-binding GntR family transcriptional regulator